MRASSLFGRVGLMGVIVGCSTPQIVTVTLHDSPSRVVQLRTADEAAAMGGFTHPVVISREVLNQVLQGLVIEEYDAALPLIGEILPSAKHSALRAEEVSFLAPLLAKGLSQATPEELLTFYEKLADPPLHERITSGGVFVQGDLLHIVISNYRVRTEIYQDTEYYEAPYHLRPLDPISPEPARLFFHPRQSMVLPPSSPFGGLFGGKPLHIAVRYKDITGTSAP